MLQPRPWAAANTLKNTHRLGLFLAIFALWITLTLLFCLHLSRLEEEKLNNDQIPSPHALVKDRLRLSGRTHDGFAVDSTYRQKRNVEGQAGAIKIDSRYANVVRGAATTCSVLREDESQRCTVKPCNSSDTNLTAENYGHDLVLRDDSVRGTTMTISGTAASGSGCAISIRYKFLYVHVLKSAGMTVKGFLKRALCKRSTEMPCKAGSEYLQIVDCARAVRDHPEFFVWSFVRNPYSRFYSAYAMADAYRKMADGTMLPAFSFQEFVLSPMQQRRKMTLADVGHFQPQSSFLFSAGDCPVFDYLGRLETFDEDLRMVMNTIDSPELKSYVAARNGTIRHDKSTAFGTASKSEHFAGDLRNAYMDVQVRDTALREYKRDFHLLGYDPKTIPTF